MEISIIYEYKAQNIIKSTEDSNLAIWKYDNHLHDTSIKNISISYNFEEKFATDNMLIANKDYFIPVNSD
jgi:hypothetical protein